MLFELQIFSGGVYPPSATSRTISFSISNSFGINFSLAKHTGWDSEIDRTDVTDQRDQTGSGHVFACDPG